MTVIALAALLLPGVFLATLWGRGLRDGITFVTTAAALAAAWMMLALWWLPTAGLGFLGWGSAAVALAGLLLLRKRWPALTWSRLTWLPLLAVAALRLYPTLTLPVAPGADMSMHGYMAWLIAHADGLPASHAPLLPIADFGAYAAGLPTLGAVLSSLSGLDLGRAMLLVACLVHLLVTGAVYSFCRHRAGDVAALGAAVLVSVASRDPQAHFLWGGNPTVLALVLIAVGWEAFDRILDGDRSLGAIGVAATTFAGALLAHSVLPYAMVYVFAVVVAARARRLDRGALRSLGAVSAGALLLVAPYLARVSLSLTPAELDWIRDWQRLPEHVPGGAVALVPLKLLWHLGGRLGWVPFGALAGGLLWLVVRRQVRLGDLGVLLVVLALVTNARLWWLPGSYALYPDRIFLLACLPIARLLAVALQSLAQLMSRRVLHVAAAAVVGLCAWQTNGWFLDGRDEVSVTADDQAAFVWIAAHVPQSDALENNYGDAGLWLPALVGRAVRTPHVNIVYMDDVAAWAGALRPRWLFVGARRVYDANSPWTVDRALVAPEWRLAFQHGGAAVFERR